MKKLLTGRQLAKRMKCDLKTVYLWKGKGVIKPVGRIGHSDVYDEGVIEQLKKYVKQHENDKRYIRIGPVIDVSEWFKKKGKKYIRIGGIIDI